MFDFVVLRRTGVQKVVDLDAFILQESPYRLRRRNLVGISKFGWLGRFGWIAPER